MERWIIPCNMQYYNIIDAFSKLNVIDWKQSMKNVEVGDEIYIYVGRPVSAILYRCKVIKTDLETQEIDDTEFVIDGAAYESYPRHMRIELLEKYDKEKYSLDVLRSRGLKGNIQGPRRAGTLID